MKDTLTWWYYDRLQYLSDLIFCQRPNTVNFAFLINLLSQLARIYKNYPKILSF